MSKNNVILKVGDDVSTDIIYPGKFMATVLPSETPKYAFADDVEFNKKLLNGEIPKENVIVAGENFGCGSSREQAVSTLKGHEFTIVAKSVARIFMQNAVNLGLRIVLCPDIEAEVGQALEIRKDRIVNVTTGQEFAVTPLPETRQAVINAGGLIPYTRALLRERSKKE